MTDTLSNKTKSGDFITPSTNDDMERLAQWEYGDDIYGTFAESLAHWRRYREDIEKAYGNEDAYYNGNVIYVDTFRPIGDQLKKLK
jgi:hypothetical protein